MSAPDQELKAAFSELQSKVLENKQKMKFHDIQIENLKRNITHSTLTDSEISQLPKDTKVYIEKEVQSVYTFKYFVQVYESVGRMFLLSDIGTVRSGLDKKTEGLKEKIHVLNGNKEYLDRQVKEQENNLRELIIAKKKQITRLFCHYCDATLKMFLH